MTTIVCPLCKKEFKKKSYQHIFCSKNCSANFHRDLNYIKRPGIDLLKGEIFLPVHGYEKLYEISNFGRIIGIILKGREHRHLLSVHTDRHGYLKVDLFKDGTKKRGAIHRLIAMSFIKNTDNKPFINHKNGIKNDNRIENLEWVTCSENINHAISIGLNSYKSGFDNKRSKITLEESEKIREMLLNGYKYKDINSIYGISPQTCRQIKYQRGHYCKN